MNNNIILIAENNTDMFENDVQVFEPTAEIPEASNQTELPSLPEVPASTYTASEMPKNSEMQTVAQKAMISFGVMTLCIVFILLIAFIIKKRSGIISTDNYEEYKETETAKKEETQPEYIQSPVRKNKISKLNTPSSIHKCIISFLEITKEN